jgi:anti-anti-sigma factor
MNLEVESFGDTQLVRVKETSLTYPALAEFYLRVSEIIESGTCQLILSLSEVSYLDSAALGCLMDISRSLDARDGTVALVGLQERVAALIGMVGLTHRMEIFDKEDQAIESLLAVSPA